MDQEQLNEFEENIRSINEILSQQAQMQASVLQQMRQQINVDRQQTSITQEQTNAAKDNVKATQEQNKAQAANTKGTQEHDKAQRHLTSALHTSASALGSMAVAALDTERNFKKYGGALDGAGDAALELGKSFGGVGIAIGAVVKGMTFVAEKALEQADNIVTATDTLRKMGSAGAYTSEEFLDLAHSAGVTSKNLDLLVKPIQNLESGVMGLGLTAGDGAKAFAQLAAVTDEQRKEFRRLGINQEELIESQSAYIQLQNATGTQMRRAGESEEQRIKRLQKESLEYTRNLTELAALTGKDVDAIKKEQEAALAKEEFMIRNLQTDQEIERLRQAGKLEEAEALQKERDVRNKLVAQVASTYEDEDLNKGLRELISTGGAIISEESAAITRQLGFVGKSFSDFQEGIEAGDEDVIAEFMEAMNAATLEAAKQVGDAGILGGAEVQKAFGLTAERMSVAARRAGEDEEEARKTTQDRISRAMRSGFDPTMDARAQLTELEIDAGVAMDKLLASVNPLVGGFGAASTAALAAAAALTAVAGSAALRSMGGLGGRLGGMGGLGGKLAGAGRAAINPANASRAVRLGAGLGAGVVAAGAGIYESVSQGAERRRDIEGRREAGLISDEEAESAQSVSSTRTAGQSAGVAAGALAGGLKGAAMGAALGPVGAAIGGMIGAGLGAWVGKTGGAMIGEAIGEQFGDAVAERDFSAEMEETSAEIEVLRATGASEEEISHLEQKLQLQEALKEAEEASDFGAMKRLLLEEELLDARQSGDHEKIDQLERQIELENQLADQTEELTQLEATLARAKEAGVGQDLLDKLQAQIDAKKADVDATKEQTQAIEDQKKAEKEAQEQEERKLELKEKIKKLEAEKSAGGGSFGSFFDPEARRKRRELEAAQAEMKEIMGVSPAEAQATGEGGQAGGETPAPSGETPAPSGETPAPSGETPAPSGETPAPSGEAGGDGGYFDKDSAFSKEMERRAKEVKAAGEVLRDLAGRMGIDTPNLRSKNVGGVPVEINGQPVPEELYTEEQKRNISAARQAAEMMPQAQKGGVFSGPETGFPVELHGTELVAPLDPNSILMELAQTSAEGSEAPGPIGEGEGAKETLERSVDINLEMMQMLSAKLDTMISVLETGNEVSDQILKQTY